MKKILTIPLLTLSLAANASFIGATDVGETDTFLFEDAKVGSTAAETLWVQTKLLDPTVNWEVKVADVSYQETDTSGIFAFELLFEPDYFLVKNSTRMALFENVASLDWGVFDRALLSSGFHFGDDFEISHVTELSGSGTPRNTVPEPGILLLLGMVAAAFGVRKFTV